MAVLLHSHSFLLSLKMKWFYGLFFFLCLQRMALPQTMIGKVVDHSGNPIQNASIFILQMNLGTISESDGTYKLNLDNIDTITVVVSHLGYIGLEKKIPFAGKSIIIEDFVLELDLLKMPEFIVRAKAESSAELMRIPSRTIELEAQDIKKTPAISTVSIFSNISGIQVHSESGFFSSSSVTIRGIGGNSQTGTLVVLDGMPLNKSDGGSVNWNIIDKDNIETIEILKGPGSALFGSNAMGGVINIITSQPDAKFKLNTSVSYGTFNTPEGKLNLSGISQNRRFFWKSFAHFRRSDGYINTPDEIIAENDTIIVPVFIEELFAGALAGYNLNERNSLEFSLNYFDDVRGRGTKIFEEYGSATHRNTIQSYLKYKGNIKNWSTYANLYGLRENYFRLNEYYSDGEYKLYEVDSKRDDFGLRLWGKVNRNVNNEIVTGGEIRLGSVDAKDIYYTSTDLISNSGMMDIAALFVQSTYTSDNLKWTFVTGLRYDFARFHDAVFSIEKPSYSIEYFADFQFDDIPDQTWGAFNPKFTLQHKPSDNLKWYVSASKGFRAPVLDDMCRSERSRFGLRIANPKLKAEHIYTLETGVDKQWNKKLLSQISVFYSKGYDFMHMLSTGDSVNLGYTIAPVFKISNITTVNISGVEVDLKYDINKVVKIFGNYSFMNAQIGKFIPNTAADIDLTGKYLTNIPMHSSATGFVFMSKIFNVSLSAKYTGQRWIKDDNQTDNIYLMSDKYDAYNVVDAKIWRKWKNFETSFDMNNVFNVIYINSRGYKSPGRMFFFKISYSFTDNSKQKK
jgi:outer membrane receptor protein involved in Fe transport